MNEKELRKIITELTELISDGVHIVDVDGVSFVYNSAMEKIEDMKEEDILGRPLYEIFDNLEEKDSTLYKALDKNEKIIDFRQTYKNKDKKEITTINSTVPVFMDGKVIAAIEVAKDLTQIKKMTDRIIEYRNKPNKLRKYNFESIVGKNEKLLSVIERAKLAAATKASVFIYGETGTGKELFSQSIHYSGERKDKPFVAQNCAAVPDSLFEGILFGTARGAFTGAVDRPGLFEEANGGTLLLDEISAMPYDLQSKLLRVLQEGEIRRIGGEKIIPIDVRIIATVNEKPQMLMDEGALRKDLYYRLNVVNIEIPPLRERKDDIEILAESFLKKHNKMLGRRVEGITKEAYEKLKEYDYSGNVRELENVIMAAVALSGKDRPIKAEDIFVNEFERKSQDDRQASFDKDDENLEVANFSQGDKQEKTSIIKDNIEEENRVINSCEEKPLEEKRKKHDSVEALEGKSIGEYLYSIEKELILKTLELENGNVSKTAEKLGMKRQTLQHKLKKY